VPTCNIEQRIVCARGHSGKGSDDVVASRRQVINFGKRATGRKRYQYRGKRADRFR
jgi:hypothetical protein